MTTTAEREYFRLAGTMLACRYQLMTGLWLGPPHPRPSLEYDMLGWRDSICEMRLLLEEARG